MYDQSFGKNTLERVLQKRDFVGITAATQDAYRNDQIAKALFSVKTCFDSPSNPLISFPLKGRLIYGFGKLADELVARKICENLKRVTNNKNSGRSQIIAALSLLLEEGVPYRIYRLDVKSFYESFRREDVISKINTFFRLSPQTKALLCSILDSHTLIGGLGVPRGLALSAVLSNLMMDDFDFQLRSNDDVYYYSRYVDDIIIVSSGRENQKSFMSWIEKKLPTGLVLNPSKRQIVSAKTIVAPVKLAEIPVRLLQFDYLGYSFHVHEPVSISKTKKSDHWRDVTVDIASSKIEKIKTRIVRSFLDYYEKKDWKLLQDRIKFLTQNFSVYNAKAGGKKLAGIYYSYPQVSDNAKGLIELDGFLRHAVLSKTGRIFKKSSLFLNAKQKRYLLSNSFVRGHLNKTFLHFSGSRIAEIQECWLH